MTEVTVTVTEVTVTVTDVMVGFRPAWRLHTNLLKCGKKFVRVNCSDLNLGGSLCIFLFFLFPDSGKSAIQELDAERCAGGVLRQNLY